MDFKSPVPDDRTIVPGIWSDTLDDFDASFETSPRDVTALGVFIRDQTAEALDIPFLSGRGTFVLDGDTVRDTRVFDAVAGHNILVGEILEFVNDATFMQTKVLIVVSDTITIDTPFNHAYSNSDTMFRSTDDMLVDGSVTPQVFSILPFAGQSGDITRLILIIESTTAMDFLKFGSKAALTNGCVLRVKREGGDFRNLFNFKSNGDFIERSFDHIFESKSGGGGFGFVSRSTYAGASKRGVTIRVDGDLGEEIQLIVQDDLSSGLTKFRMVAQGHELQG